MTRQDQINKLSASALGWYDNAVAGDEMTRDNFHIFILELIGENKDCDSTPVERDVRYICNDFTEVIGSALHFF